MGLQSQLVPINFAKGVDTKTDPKQVVPGKLLALTNGTFETIDQISKRNGYVALSQNILGGTTIAAGAAVASYQTGLTMLDGRNLFGWSPSGSNWAQSEGIQPLSVTSIPIFRGVETQDATNGAYDAVSGLSATISLDDQNNIRYSIFDAVTHQIIVNGTVVSTSASPAAPRIYAFSNQFVFLWAIGSDLKWTKIPTSSPLLTPVIQTLIAGGGIFDAKVIDQRLFIAYSSSSTATSVAYLDSNFTLSAATTVSGSDTATSANAITVFGDASDNVWVGFASTTAVRGYVRDYNLTASVRALTTLATVSNANNLTGVWGQAQGIGFYFYQVSSTTATAGTIQYVNSVHLSIASGAGGNTTSQKAASITGKAFYYSGDVFVPLVTGSAGQTTFFLYNFTLGSSGTLVAKMATQAAVLNSVLSEVIVKSSAVFQIALLQQNENSIGSQLFTLTFGISPHSYEVASNLHFSGGFLWMYDGANTYEHGFHIYPDRVVGAAGTSGGSIADGTYSYKAIYEWIDNQGLLHRSAPSLPITVVVSGGSGSGKVDVYISTLFITAKPQNVPYQAPLIKLYRTTSGGTEYFQIANGSGDYNPTTDFMHIVDTSSDSSITGNEQLYTDSGELEAGSPPAPLAVFPYKDRLCVIPSEVPTSWWFSKEILSDPPEPAEFSPFLVQNETGVGGDFTSGLQMDDKLILFKRDTVFYVVGNGPAPNGTSNDFTPAQQIVTDTGCNNAASLVLMPDGLMYQSPKGIYLLDRSLKDHSVGDEVQAYTENASVTSAQLIPGTTQVRFTLSSGMALVYDYNDAVRGQNGFGQWSVFTNIAAVSSTIFGAEFTYLTAGGLVLKETPGVFTDNGTGIQLSLTTAWLKLAGLQGFQRVYKMLLLGTYASSHTLQVEVAYDFVSTVKQTDNIVASTTPPYQYRVNLQRQKCEAIQFVIQDTSPTGESLSLSAITLEVGIKGGPNRMAPTRSYG